MMRHLIFGIAAIIGCAFASISFASRYTNPIIFHQVTGTVNQTSNVIDAAFLNIGSLQGTVLGTTGLQGTVILQGSNDPSGLIPFGNSPQNWSNLSPTQAVTGTTTFMLTFNPISYRWLRVLWNNISGTSGIQGTVSVNGFFQGQ